MKKIEAYRILDRADQGAAFLANVLLTRGGKDCAKRLIKLATLVQSGSTVSLAPYSTSDLQIDHKMVRWSELDSAKVVNGRVMFSNESEMSEDEKRIEKAREIFFHNECPDCGAGLHLNLALTGWVKCDNSKCSFQTFIK